MLSAVQWSSRACLHGGGGPQIGEVTCHGSPHLSPKNAKQRYYSDLIEECGGDTRKLFQVVRSLSNKPEENQLPPHDDPRKLADDFGEFFCGKVDLIRNDIDAITVAPPVLNVPTPENKFEKFDVLPEEEVSDIIMDTSNAS